MIAEQQRIEALRALREFALTAARECPGTESQEAALQVVAAHVYELLVGLDPQQLQDRLEGDVAAFTHLANTLARLSVAALAFQRYRTEVAERKARLEAELAAAKKDGLTPDTLDHIEAQLHLL